MCARRTQSGMTIMALEEYAPRAIKVNGPRFRVDLSDGSSFVCNAALAVCCARPLDIRESENGAFFLDYVPADFRGELESRMLLPAGAHRSRREAYMRAVSRAKHLARKIQYLSPLNVIFVRARTLAAMGDAVSRFRAHLIGDVDRGHARAQRLLRLTVSRLEPGPLLHVPTFNLELANGCDVRVNSAAAK